MSPHCRVSRFMAFICPGTYRFCVKCDTWHIRIKT